MNEKRFLLLYVNKYCRTSYLWFETEEDLFWTIKNNTDIEPMEAFDIKNARRVDIIGLDEITDVNDMEQSKCSACNGSGWYDSCDNQGNPIKCGACEGTGLK